MNPMEIGNAVFIRCVTMYYVGRVVKIDDEKIILDDAAWVADTGRFSEALKSGVLKEVEPFPNMVAIYKSSICDATSWPHPIPLALK